MNAHVGRTSAQQPHYEIEASNLLSLLRSKLHRCEDVLQLLNHLERQPGRVSNGRRAGYARKWATKIRLARQLASAGRANGVRRLVQFRAPNGRFITGRAEATPGVAELVTFEVVQGHAPEPIWEGGTTMHWDDQEPRLDERQRPIYVDDEGHHWSLDDCTEEPDTEDR